MGHVMASTRVGWVTAFTLAALVGCGGIKKRSSDDDVVPDPPSSDGGRGNDDPSVATGGTPAGGEEGGEGGEGGSPVETGGTGGTAPLRDDVVEATESGIDADEFITDLALLDGKSFVLPKGLCPKKAWEGHGWVPSYDQRYARSLRTLHLRRQGDTLELVSSMATDQAPSVERTWLARESSGFSAKNLFVCNDTVLIDQTETQSYEVPRAYLAFVLGKEPGTVELRFGAHIDGEERPVVLTGTPDREAPAFQPLRFEGFLLDEEYEIPQSGAVQAPYYFFFDEPLRDGVLALDDGDGDPVTLHPIEADGFLVGFHVDDLIAGEPAFDLEVTDLAGNAWLPGETYAGISLAPTDGDLESVDDYILEDEERWGACWQGSLLPDGSKAAPVPPLRGDHSLFLDTCPAYFRMTRSPGATHLNFEARAFHAQPPFLEVEVRVIGANGPSTSWTYDPEGGDPSTNVEWLPDPDYAKFVSLPTKISVPLPETGDDLLVKVAAQDFWLDGLTTE